MKRVFGLAFGLLALMPRAADAYTAHHVFVTNRGGNNVIELDADLKFVKTWFDSAGLSVPNGMAFDPSDRMYVADTGNDRIVVFDASGNKVNEWSTKTLLAPQVESLNFDSTGRLFASANPGNGTVASWKADGSDQKVFVSDPAFVALANVNFSIKGNVLLSDFSWTHGVRELDPKTGAVIQEFGQGTSLHEDMVIDADDNLFVSAYATDQILKFDATRTKLDKFSPPGLKSPTGIVLTSQCKLVVASFGSNEIFELDYDGTFIRKVAVPGLSIPESLVIARLSVAGGIALSNPVPDCDGIDGGVAGSGGVGGSGATGGSAGTSTGGASGSGATGSGGTAATGGASSGGSTGGSISDAGITAPRGGTSSDSGCGCELPGRGSRPRPSAVVLLGLLALIARRRSNRTSGKRHAASIGVIGIFLLFNVATSKSKPTPIPTGSPVAPPAVTAQTVADLDLPSVKTTLACANAKTDACRILDEFATASKFDEVPAAATTKVWMGQTFAVGGPANGKKQYFFLQVQRGALVTDPTVAKESLLQAIGTARWLRPDNEQEEKDSAALVAALKGGKPAPAKNAAVDFVKKPAGAEIFRSIAKTSGASAVIVKTGEHRTYVRKAGNRVLVIEYDNGTLLDDAKAWCAEAWSLP